MIENLRAKHVRNKEIESNIFELKPNTPKLIDKKNNDHIAHVYEKKENENLFIHSQFCENYFAFVCNEFYLNFLKNPKRVDLSYYGFTKDNSVSVYLYDMKKTFSGVDVIIHLIEQWKSSICDAKYCIEKLENYELLEIHIGVITEENNINRRNSDLEPYLYPKSISNNIPSFMVNQRKADTAELVKKAKLLHGFDEGKVTICGITYEYDVRMFDEKKNHHMYFNNGVLKK